MSRLISALAKKFTLTAGKSLCCIEVCSGIHRTIVLHMRCIDYHKMKWQLQAQKLTFQGTLTLLWQDFDVSIVNALQNNWKYQAKWIRADQSHLDSHKSYSRVAIFFNSLAKNLATTRNSKTILIYTNIHSHKITQYYQIVSTWRLLQWTMHRLSRIIWELRAGPN